jgi:hypothetical protein
MNIAGMSARRPAAVWTALILAAAPGARAQQAGGLADGARDSLRLPWADVTTRCVTPGPTPYATPASGSACRVESVTALGAGQGRDWHLVRHVGELIVRDSAFTDTMPFDQLVLVGHAPGSADAEVAWRWASDRRIQFLDTAVAIPTSQGLLLELRVCLNGTGGCGYQYYRLAHGGWRPMVQAFLDDLSSRLPSGHSLHKGRTLDLATLSGVWPVAAPGDANCCPSFRIAFRLRLDGDTLRLVESGPLRRESGR